MLELSLKRSTLAKQSFISFSMFFLNKASGQKGKKGLGDRWSKVWKGQLVAYILISKPNKQKAIEIAWWIMKILIGNIYESYITLSSQTIIWPYDTKKEGKNMTKKNLREREKERERDQNFHQ